MGRTTSIVGAVALVLATAGPALAQDDPRTRPVFDTTLTLADILTAAKAQGKGMVLVLGGGVTYTGKIKDVGPHAVILTELRGKEFFDAYVPLPGIVSLEERVRLR